MSIKKFALAASASLSAFGLGACDSGQTTQQSTPNATTRSAHDLIVEHIESASCVVRGRTYNQGSQTLVLHDFANSTSAFRTYGGLEIGYSIAFNDVTNPAQQARITAAHALLPASANCPAPVFPAAAR